MQNLQPSQDTQAFWHLGARGVHGDDYGIAGPTEDSIDISLDEAVAFGSLFFGLDCSQRSLAKGSLGGSMGNYLQTPRG